MMITSSSHKYHNSSIIYTTRKFTMSTPQSTRYPCPLAVLGCEQTFSRKQDAARHSEEKSHFGIDTSIYCPFPGCFWTTTRFGRYDEHIKKHNGKRQDKPLKSPSHDSYSHSHGAYQLPICSTKLFCKTSRLTNSSSR